MMAEAVVNVSSKIIIMVCGKVGIGKSTLLNTLLGTKGMFVVNGPGGVGENCMEAGTKGLSSVSEMIHGVEVTMYDTPGLQSDPSDKDSIALMANIKDSVDLVLFCIDGTVNRWAAEAKIVKTLHAAFGNEFWMNAIFVITRSNMIQSSLVDDDDEDLQPNEKVAKCEKAAKDIFESFKKELLMQNASPDVVSDIPLVAAGNHKRRRLLFVAPKVSDADFLLELWSQAIKRCKVQKRVLFYVVSNYKQQRFRLKDNSGTLSPEEHAQVRKFIEVQDLNAIPTPLSVETDLTTQFHPLEIPQEQELLNATQSQTIVLNEKQSNRVRKALAASLGLLGVGAASGITGVGVGATVWAATSLTMVAAGPVGVGVGAAVGLIGLGVFAGVVIYQYKKSKKLETVTSN